MVWFAHAQKNVSGHIQGDLVGKEEKCEYEAFVTDPFTCGLGFAETISNAEKERTREARL